MNSSVYIKSIERRKCTKVSGNAYFTLDIPRKIINFKSFSFFSMEEDRFFHPLRNKQMKIWARKDVEIAISYIKKGKESEAFSCLDKALKVDPENAEAFVAKGAL